MKRFTWLLLPLVLIGCSRSRLDESAELVSCRLQERIGGYTHHTREQAPFEEFVQSALCQPLDVECAVQIALLNNPNIQALLEDLGIASADLIEAGLFTNPFFNLYNRHPSTSPRRTNIQIEIGFSFLDLLLVPLRKRVAESALEQAQALVTHEILDVAFDVQTTFFHLVTAKKQLEKLDAIVELRQSAMEIAAAQEEGGNITEPHFAGHRFAYQEALIMRLEKRQEVATLTSELGALLGLQCPTSLQLRHDLPSLPARTPSMDSLLCLACEKRFDLQALYWQMKGTMQAGDLETWWAYTDLSLGASSEREPDSLWTTGPLVGLLIPLFNRGQGVRQRLMAEFWQTLHAYQAVRVEIAQELGRIQEQVEYNKQILSHYKDHIFPTLENKLAVLTEFYFVAVTDIFTWMNTKVMQLEQEILFDRTRFEQIALFIELNRTVGGSLDVL